MPKLDPPRESTRTPRSRRWSEQELERLRRLAWSMTAAQLAVLLGRTPLAVRTKAAHERIRLRPDPHDVH